MPSQLRTLTWYLRSPKDIDLQDDRDMSYFLKGSADPVSLRIRARTPPTGQALVVDVQADGVSMLFDGIQGRLPPGISDHRSTNVATMKAPAGAAVTLSLIQVGSQEAGRGVTVEMTINETIP